VKRALDKQASAWLDKAVAVCEDTRVRGLVSEAGLDLRTACLDRRRRELATLGRLLTEADAKMVARAPRSRSPASSGSRTVTTS
jgi:hypothetical protein